MISAARFIEDLVDPETGKPFGLTEAERAFLAHAFELDADGRLKYPELVFSAPKKSGKTALGAMVMLYTVVALGGRYAEGYVGANTMEQSTGRVFQAAARIVAATPFLKRDAVITQSRITFRSTGATIIALPNDYAGAAGSNPTVTVFDELWAFTSEAEHRFWDEMVPPPTRQIACRLTVTYAGFQGESKLLEQLYKRGLQGDLIGPSLYAQPGLLMAWHHEFTAPWQTEAWREQMRGQLRPNAYLRLVENRWVSSESTFVDLAWWDGCVDPAATPILSDRSLSAWLGVDASLKRDSTAIVAVAYDDKAKKVRLLAHRVFQPQADDPLQFEATVEETVLEYCRRFSVRGVHYDPWQMQAVAQRLQSQGVKMVEYPQTVGNLTEAGTNLYELIKGQNLLVYPDAGMRLAVQRAVAKETSRGWKISKESASHKIDVVVALAMACVGAKEQIGGGAMAGWLGYYRAELAGAAQRLAAKLKPGQPAASPVPGGAAGTAEPPETADPYLQAVAAKNAALRHIDSVAPSRAGHLADKGTAAPEPAAVPAPQGTPPSERGATAMMQQLPGEHAPLAPGEVRLVTAPWQAFYVPAPNGGGRKFTGDSHGVIVAPSEFLPALVASGCRPVG
jgi:Phage Terminase